MLTPFDTQVVADLRRATAPFQARTLAMRMGLSADAARLIPETPRPSQATQENVSE